MIREEHKHNSQHQLRSPIHDREEHKHNSQHQLRSPIHDREEHKHNSQHHKVMREKNINIIVNIS